ncbi:hypothetical protein C4K14_4099 [Pseudomonas chlororaphis subsp. aureofaciens]|uniref:Shedu immune nuclease family protein n=1 Tax=Pseudomonas chlororaphis TaxID=587753 RepID=UPI000F5798B8|nr:Shedu immune nuclease family protein [Pseudomonas chlororaphis]AZD86921.1 hypothetical protein C4K14_4099 [Pseudomonas chlororaphis subsp. aureofaciens]
MAVKNRHGQLKLYTYSEALTPAFRTEEGIADGMPYRNLFLQTFVRSQTSTEHWLAQPEKDWHLLARVLPHQIVMFPVFTNPLAQRYLRPRHGRFKTVIYEQRFKESLPDTQRDLTAFIESCLPWNTFNPCDYGLGLISELDEIWLGLSHLPNVDTIVLAHESSLRVKDNTVWIAEEEVERIRRAFKRTMRKMRDVVKQTKTAHIRNALLASLNPDRFPPIVQVDSDGQLVEVRLDRGRQSLQAARSQRRSTMKAVHSNVGRLAIEAPVELIELHAEIERVTLARMIEQYESMLEKSLSETHWQKFFERNVFILTMLFARPVRLLHSQFHAQGSGLDGAGAQIGDYLFAEQGFAMAIVEIKKPSSPLMRTTAYRNKDVFAPDSELSGAVTQVLYQQSKLHETWLVHQVRPELRDSRPDAIRCVVIAGTMPIDEGPRRSFEVFRNACKNVEVVTFDELLGKLRLLLSHLTPREVSEDDPNWPANASIVGCVEDGLGDVF